MSGYWAGYYGAGLVLTQNEMDDFIEKYRTRIGMSEEDFKNKLLNELPIEEIPWVRSDEDPNQADPRLFDITNINTDNCEGMFFIPFMYNKKPNTRYHQDKVYTKRYDENLYVIFSDKSLDSASCFTEKPYPSYDAFVQEFKNKLNIYVPDNFDWDAHIGNISYACYA